MIPDIPRYDAEWFWEQEGAGAWWFGSGRNWMGNGEFYSEGLAYIHWNKSTYWNSGPIRE